MERQRKMEEDRYYEEKLEHERQILQERYDMERQRDIKLKAKAFKNQEPPAVMVTNPGDVTPNESKKGILKSKSDAKLKSNVKNKRSIRFEDEVPVEELKSFNEELQKKEGAMNSADLTNSPNIREVILFPTLRPR